MTYINFISCIIAVLCPIIFKVCCIRVCFLLYLCPVSCSCFLGHNQSFNDIMVLVESLSSRSTRKTAAQPSRCCVEFKYEYFTFLNLVFLDIYPTKNGSNQIKSELRSDWSHPNFWNLNKLVRVCLILIYQSYQNKFITKSLSWLALQ